MIPGIVSKLSESVLASAASISPKTDLVRLTGTTSIDTIVPAIPANATVLFLVPTGGNVATTTNGNINAAVTMVDERVTVLVYSPVTGKWYPGAIS